MTGTPAAAAVGGNRHPTDLPGSWHSLLTRAAACHTPACPVASQDHVLRALTQLGFDEWADEVRASHEEFKQEAKSGCGGRGAGGARTRACAGPS
jgi:hypothetical protein